MSSPIRLEDLLTQERTAILDKWLRLILKTYPAETSRFFEQEPDRFRNPVGAAISRGIEFLYDALLRQPNREEISAHLDPIVRIRAVQDFSPSEAVGFVFLLKQAIREQLKDKIGENGLREQLSVIELRIDDLGLLAFDVYTQCRERIYELRTDEMKRQAFQGLRRSSRV